MSREYLSSHVTSWGVILLLIMWPYVALFHWLPPYSRKYSDKRALLLRRNAAVHTLYHPASDAGVMMSIGYLYVLLSDWGLSLALATNTIGPLLMAKYFSPLLLKGRGAFGAQSSDRSKQHNGIIVNMSAKVGSISDNGLGGWYSYRISKSALNMATKCLSIELGRGKNKVICVSLHPGTVETDLSRPYHKNVPKEKLFSPERSVTYLMAIIDSLNMDRTGRFYSWNGTELQW
ncbi:1-hydroxy-2-glutathionyl-2-methyl-3-butene dehydrogenase-like isoform X2 [Hyla sarda]|uniref:1-hydroxy-2-glutathionyl-2-methyl-3-butene dehydrogenase-like isoform X2 n=1 Tax=Hyla sarda TaxID=327740 RepID=UPI0024C3C9E3|nr:1-hydroxy-2-glutathionyl-2-methyl-3-butene dehydrogenase-like isoform X2 [Hyla sarda]